MYKIVNYFVQLIVFIQITFSCKHGYFISMTTFANKLVFVYFYYSTELMIVNHYLIIELFLSFS